jgi:hypothetical protein
MQATLRTEPEKFIEALLQTDRIRRQQEELRRFLADNAPAARQRHRPILDKR